MMIFNIMLSPEKGGLQSMSMIYALAMRKIGHEVICVVRNTSPYIVELKNKGFELYIYNGGSPYNLWNIFKLIRFIAKRNGDIVVCHGKRAIHIMVNKVINMVLKPKFKIIGVMHSKDCSFKSKCDKLIFLTERQLQRQTDFIKSKSFVLANTILDNGYSKDSLHNPITFGAMGRLHKVKGYDILLNALSILKKQGIEFKFILAGQGVEEKNLQSQANKLDLEDCVSFIGWVNNKKHFFDMIDVFVLSSRSDVMPLSILESFAFSVPVIATQCDGPQEIMSQNFNSMLTPLQNAHALATTMERIVKNKHEILNLGKKTKDLFNKQYSFDAFADKLNYILNEVSK